MNEERQNAYYQLIQALLNCPSGEEAEILQAHPDLQDAGLVQTMLEVADNLRREGDLNNSNRLMNIARLLLTIFGISSAPSTSKAEADRLLNLGIEQYNTSQFRPALQSWEQALTIYREIGDRQGEAASLGNLGLAYYSLGQFKVASEYHQQQLAISRIIVDYKGEANSLRNLGLVYNSLGQYKLAINYLKESLETAKEIEYSQGEANSLGGLGLAYYYLAKYQLAIDCHKQQLAIAHHIRDSQGEAVSLRNLGIVFYALGQYQEAIKYQLRSVAIARELEDHQGEASSLGNLGNAYYYLGQYQKASDNLQQILSILRQIGDRQGEANVLGSLGNVFHSLGQYKEAVVYHHQYLEIASQIGDRKGEANSLGNLGLAFHYLGKYQVAIDCHNKSLVIKREIGDRQGEANSLGSLGLAYHSLGQYQVAIDYHQQNLAIAREIGSRQGEANSLGNLGNAYYSLGQYQRAIDYHQQSLGMAREIGDREGESISLNNLGQSFLKINQLPEAEEILYAAMQIKETLRSQLTHSDHRVSIFETQTNTYRLLQQVLVAQNKFDIAIEISERGRTRAFVELLMKQKTPSQTSHLQANINLTSAQMQQIAQSQKATIIEYSIVFEDIYIWVILPNGEITFRRANLQPLQEAGLTLDYLESIILKSRVSIGIEEKDATGQKIKLEPEFKLEQGRYPLLQLLYEILISPIADLLPQHPNAKVIFIPHYNLFLVPFPALQNPADGSYLIENHTILTAPSIQILDITHQHHQNIRGLNQASLVVGDPIIAAKFRQDPYNLKPIPAAKEAAEQIAALLETEAITGEKATKAVILDRILGVRIAHISAHGLLDDFGDSGIPGAIILAPTSATDDGAIRAIDILALKLNSEIVVLSACSTGKGRITGDGIIGLSRCFILAGVPSVIVSLWNMGALSAKLLMTEFYQNLEKGMDRSAALRDAMLRTKAEEGLDSPADWAAFTLIGETESLSLNTRKIEQQELTMPFSPERTPQEIINAFFKLLETSNVFSNYLEFMEELKAEPTDRAQEIAKKIEAWCKDKPGIEKGINNKLSPMGPGGTDSKPDDEVAREFNDRLIETRTRLGSPPPSSSSGTSGTKNKN